MLGSHLVELFEDILESLWSEVYLQEADPWGQALGGIFPVLPVSLSTSHHHHHRHPWSEYLPSATGSSHVSQRFSLEQEPSDCVGSFYSLMSFLLGI